MAPIRAPWVTSGKVGERVQSLADIEMGILLADKVLAGEQERLGVGGK